MRTLLLILLVGCSRSPGNAPAPDPTGAARTERPLTSDVTLTPAGEPGTPLTVNGVLLRAEDRSPAPSQRLRVYQADARGDYQAKDPDDERTARLAADVITDADGRFVVRTIMPGAYGNPLGDPHLHIEVIAARPPMHVVYFEGFLQEDTIRWQKTTKQAHIVPVTRAGDGAITGPLSLPVYGLPR